MARRIKIRLSSWYWGAFEWSDSYSCKKNDWRVGSKAHGHVFEVYDEAKHGWHNSEEFKNGQLKEWNPHE